MVRRSHRSAAIAIIRQLCPRCREGKIFKSSVFLGCPKMNAVCGVCNLKFEREEGYFLGAMYISYGLALLTITLLALLLWGITNWTFEKIVIRAVLLFLPMAPAITLLSRVLWIYVDQTIDPERPA